MMKQGFRHCQRAGGGRTPWGECGEHEGEPLTAVTPLPHQFLPLMPVSPAHYKAISPHLTASDTDDELPLISLKQTFVPCTAGDSKAPVEPIPLIARRVATAAPAAEHHKGFPSPVSFLLEAALGIACLIDCLQCRVEYLMSRGNRKAEVSKQMQQGKLTLRQFYSSSSQSSLCHLVTPPLLRTSCPAIQQPVPKKLRRLAPCPVSRSLAGRPGLHASCAHAYTRTLPSPRCAGEHRLGEILPKAGTEQLPCVPPASCLLCIDFVSLFMTKLESQLPGP